MAIISSVLFLRPIIGIAVKLSVQHLTGPSHFVGFQHLTDIKSYSIQFLSLYIQYNLHITDFAFGLQLLFSCHVGERADFTLYIEREPDNTSGWRHCTFVSEKLASIQVYTFDTHLGRPPLGLMPTKTNLL